MPGYHCGNLEGVCILSLETQCEKKSDAVSLESVMELEEEIQDQKMSG